MAGTLIPSAWKQITLKFCFHPQCTLGAGLTKSSPDRNFRTRSRQLREASFALITPPASQMLGHASSTYPLFKTCLTLLSLQHPLHTYHDHRSTLLLSNPTMIYTSIFRNSQWVAAAPPHRRPSPVIFIHSGRLCHPSCTCLKERNSPWAFERRRGLLHPMFVVIFHGVSDRAM
ncbi:hypothetical protein DFP72DRAFT_108409 [Ephemerocybe angulata]|uniref:Uncharacterized protein n=1 Tax=Ephemerocybe angulata TaxID=980116 RepID=A0A8H6HBA0_9AGAR|nr:hypothetical protein DFP72DRAFT_108409 [Tulosesus angulatus]